MTDFKLLVQNEDQKIENKLDMSKISHGLTIHLRNGGGSVGTVTSRVIHGSIDYRITGHGATSPDFTYDSTKRLTLHVTTTGIGNGAGIYRTSPLSVRMLIRASSPFPPVDGIVSVGPGQIGTPTYLETLDKLDQWSSAQYTPQQQNQIKP